jgi:hypothetical protein
MTQWQNDKSWAQDKIFSKLVKILHGLGYAECSVASKYLDQSEATDIVADEKHIAVRVRRTGIHRGVTLRALRGSGHETELKKIMSGFGDYMLYVWIDGNNEVLDWVFVSLQCVRKAPLALEARRRIPNTDDETWFIDVGLFELMDHGCIKAYYMSPGTRDKFDLKFMPGRVDEETRYENTRGAVRDCDGKFS